METWMLCSLIITGPACPKTRFYNVPLEEPHSCNTTSFSPTSLERTNGTHHGKKERCNSLYLQSIWSHQWTITHIKREIRCCEQKLQRSWQAGWTSEFTQRCGTASHGHIQCQNRPGCSKWITRRDRWDFLPEYVLVKLQRTKATRLEGLEEGALPLVPMERIRH